MIDPISTITKLNRNKHAIYTLNDGLIDVNGDVSLHNLHVLDLEKLFLKFGKVEGDFTCFSSSMKSLLGCPTYITGDFSCYSNNLKSLVGGPKIVQGNYHCSHNLLKNLEGIATFIGKALLISNNPLEHLGHLLLCEHIGYCYADDEDLLLTRLFDEYHIVRNKEIEFQ